MRIAPGSRPELRVEWGGFQLDSLRPPQTSPAEWRERQKAVAVWLDGKQVLRGQVEFSRPNPQKVNLGGAEEEGLEFSGQIIAIRREPFRP